MLEELATAVATGAAGNVVAYMLNGRVDALRAQITRIFRHGDKSERSIAFRALNDDIAALKNHEASKDEVAERWTGLLASYLIAHPEARKDIDTFTAASAANKATFIGSQHNHGPGTFIGGDNYGDMAFGSQE